MKKILIDGREFVYGRRTGIGRFLRGFVDALADSNLDIEITLCLFDENLLPDKLRDRKRIKSLKIQPILLLSEWTFTNLSKEGFHLFISPYPKLPFFGTHCLAVNTIHDVLDLTHPAYRGGFKVYVNTLRLKKALKEADLTWYDSLWSLKETKRYARLTGENPKVRHLGISERFNIETAQNQSDVLKKYNLQPGYVLVIGNGLPHKNLGLLLSMSDQISRELVFVGVSQTNQKYWKAKYPHSQAIWIEYVHDENLPVIMKNAFCLAQPSKEEGYGYPPLEAMACGVPAVVSHISVLVETTGGNALKANPEDSCEWVKAFEALEDKDIYRDRIENGLKWVQPLRGRIGWQKHISDIEELLRKN